MPNMRCMYDERGERCYTHLVAQDVEDPVSGHNEQLVL